MKFGNFPLADDLNSIESSVILGMVKSSNDSNMMKETEYNEETNGDAGDQNDDFVSEKDRDPDNAFELDEHIESENEILSEEFINKNSKLEDFKDLHIGSLVYIPTETKYNLSLEQIVTPNSGVSIEVIWNG
uniref:Uncharacterized protein n=1 Tax=Nelumbo nucifera TaxID=4432 RepID=A0A822YPN3_NELNU|nr:TPA_asm: hypothetical protein HUJ06_005190 [Nelumbo nucifera]